MALLNQADRALCLSADDMGGFVYAGYADLRYCLVRVLKLCHESIQKWQAVDLAMEQSLLLEFY